ncbi:MAG TPA: sigma-70 family RNA polymerase sigma factor [Candidatus Ventricola gallistercoris]|nr:sigma-70 family RNA polymerase sigma factor [Candidatus Ventricola gallistercoris]
MDRYEKDLLRMCCMYLRDMNMAEDAVQETFLKAYNALSSFRGDSSEKTWLYRIAVNVCNDMRRNAWYRFIDKRIDLDRLQIPVEAQSEESLALMTEIMRLPRKWMEVVLLYYYEDIRIPQIAEMLGVSQTMVSRRLKKARELLKTQWRE